MSTVVTEQITAGAANAGPATYLARPRDLVVDDVARPSRLVTATSEMLESTLAGSTAWNGALERRASRPPRNGQRYRVLGYRRVSNERGSDNYTFDTQEARVIEKLDRHYGRGNYDLELLEDDGLSGHYGPRKTGIQKRVRATLQEIENRLREGSFDAFVVYKLNRLFRNYRWVGVWVEDVFLPNQMELLSATEEVDLGTPEGRTMLGLIAVFDESTRAGIVQRNKDALATRVEDGYYIGKEPYGWQRESRDAVAPGKRVNIVPNPEQVPHVLFMKEKYVSGWGSTKIAADLNARGVTTANGYRWASGQVMKVVECCVHAGYVHSGRKGLIQGQHYEHRLYELADLEEVKRVHAQRNKRGSTNTLKPNMPHLVNGLVHCARCGRRLYIYTGNSAYRAYRCQKGNSEGKHTCRDVTVRAEWIEDVVVKEIDRLSQEPAMRELLLAEATRATDTEDNQLRSELEQLRERGGAVQQRLDRLMDKLSNDLITDAEFSEARGRMNAEKTIVQERLREVECLLDGRSKREAWVDGMQQAILDFPLCWQHLTLDERVQVLGTLVETLTVDKAGRDAIVHLKLHLLPERTIPICAQSMRHRMKDRPLGVPGLTRRQLSYLYYIGQGKTNKQIAAEFGNSAAASHNMATQVRKVLGVKNMMDAYHLAKARIEEVKDTLCLGPMNIAKQHVGDGPVLCATLAEVFPLLAQGAKVTEVMKITGLSRPAVNGRMRRILDHFNADTIYEAAQKARAAGVLPGG